MVIRVLIIDAHEMVRRSLAAFLDVFDDLELVGQAADGLRGLALCAELLPDVVLTELDLRHLDGIALTRRITQIFPHIKVIALDITQHQEAIEAVLKAGASVYLTKEINIDELAQAIRNVVKESRVQPMYAQTG